MVKLDKIYTRGGDKGKTSLGNGERVDKNSIRVEAFGTVDETNAVLGIAIVNLKSPLKEMIFRIQNDLFDLGADLCVPDNKKLDYEPLRINQFQVDRLEEEIDTMNSNLDSLKSFILPAPNVLVRREEDTITYDKSFDLSIAIQLSATIWLEGRECSSNMH